MKHVSSPAISRRKFLRRSLATAGVIAGAPAFLRGQNLNSKLNIAFIGAGGRANTSFNELTLSGAAAASAAAKKNSARALADLGREPGPHPDENVTVLCDINQQTLDGAGLRFPKARKVVDLRRVFDHAKEFDAVVVSTAEHTHVFAAWLALTHGKHVYCEKPLAYNIWETRLLRETAAKYPKLSTQMGNQGHASQSRRTIREILDTGVIGPVREAHVWADRAWGLQDAASAEKFDKPHGFYLGTQITERFKEEMPVPSYLNWDLWIGPAPMRPFHATYFPGPRWYRWWDFANGTMSDLGSHDNDVPFTVLDLWRTDAKGNRVLAPISVEASSPNVPTPHPELAPATLKATFQFAATGAQPALKLVWHQGDSKPPGWTPAWGNRSSIFIGDKGMLLGNGRLLPEEKFKGFTPPPARLPRSPGHWIEWVDHAKGNGPVPGSNFQYSGWTTECNHLGNVAYRAGKKLEWDYAALRATNAPEAAPLIRRPSFRSGWQGILPA
ncbi:MAG: Gfo/Idh/MocA family oxidoreductase [Opitutaceae bacterium]|nr:Gfo/Idh/MocA family oxidoreductase [Opitutaceae bacterium]